MDIKILDSWLRDYLDTKATPEIIAKDLSLCGPSIERIKPADKDYIYSIEVTTNRVDTASVYGIAREASVILPRFGVPAKLKTIDQKPTAGHKFVKKVNYLSAIVDPKLCQRFTAVLVKNVKIDDSPEWVRTRLESADVRPINNVVDISNYIMLALGQPVHTFDYDKIYGAKMILRESKKGEKITTLDSKTFTLNGGDIVIEDGEKRLIDLAGVMGGDLSAVDSNTKNVLLFVQTYNPVNIRKTSMGLAQRTTAATIFEKGTDTELVTPAMLSAIHLFEHLTGGKVEKEVLDIYPNPYKAKSITTSLEFIEKRLGVTIPKKEISQHLNQLEFKATWTGDKLKVEVPSFRSRDIEVEEDVVEEIARIYGYHNLPSKIMDGELNTTVTPKEFAFEKNLKNILSGWGATEVYTLSLVPKEYVSEGALKLKNPLGQDSEYLRTSLMPSLISAAKQNIGTVEKFHLFEMANIYLPRRSQAKAGMDLPEERLMLTGVFENYDYRNAKGIIEALLEKLHIKATFVLQENPGFAAGKSVSIVSDKNDVGKLGYVDNSKLIYYEFEVRKLMELAKPVERYKEISKYPAQIEDLTLVFPEKTMVGNVIETITSMNRIIEKVELRDIFNDAYTFRVWYQDPEKTLTDSEVEKIRKEILSSINNKFGGKIKE